MNQTLRVKTTRWPAPWPHILHCLGAAVIMYWNNLPMASSSWIRAARFAQCASRLPPSFSHLQWKLWPTGIDHETSRVSALSKCRVGGACVLEAQCAPHPGSSRNGLGDARPPATYDCGYCLNESNPRNGLIADRTQPGSPSSIAAVGLGLSGYIVAVE